MEDSCYIINECGELESIGAYDDIDSAFDDHPSAFWFVGTEGAKRYLEQLGAIVNDFNPQDEKNKGKVLYFSLRDTDSFERLGWFSEVGEAFESEGVLESKSKLQGQNVYILDYATAKSWLRTVEDSIDQASESRKRTHVDK